MASWQSNTKLMIVIVSLAILFGLWLPVAAQQPSQVVVVNNGETPREVISRINQWRIGEGLWPLRENETLTALAQGQAAYLASLPALPEGEALHNGRGGEIPARRAAAPPHNWPSYGRVDRTNIGENAAVGSVSFALNYWKSSSIHARTALNPGYREIGAAMWPTREGILHIVVFGGRPGVMPVLVNPQEQMLYIPNERYRFKSGGAWLQDAKKIRIIDKASNKILTDGAIPWTQKLPIPAGNTGIIIVEFSGEGIQTQTEVDLAHDLVNLPGIVPVVSVPTPTPTLIPFGANAGPLPTVQVVAATPVPPTPAPTTVAIRPQENQAAKPDLTVIYNSQSLFILNISGKAVNLTAVQLSAATGFTIAADRWTRAASFPVAAFPANHCLLLVVGGASPTPPTECRFVRSELQVSRAQLFWTLGEFVVLNGGQPVATCGAYQGGAAIRCNVALSSADTPRAPEKPEA